MIPLEFIILIMKTEAFMFLFDSSINIKTTVTQSQNIKEKVQTKRQSCSTFLNSVRLPGFGAELTSLATTSVSSIKYCLQPRREYVLINSFNSRVGQLYVLEVACKFPNVQIKERNIV